MKKKKYVIESKGFRQGIGTKKYLDKKKQEIEELKKKLNNE